MLVLSRKLNDAIVINGNIRIVVVGIRGSHVRLGIEAPESVGIFREELFERYLTDTEDADNDSVGLPYDGARAGLHSEPIVS